jgi:hypothetical protein
MADSSDLGALAEDFLRITGETVCCSVTTVDEAELGARQALDGAVLVAQ